MPKAKKKSKRKSSSKRQTKKAKNKVNKISNERIFFTIAAILVIAAIIVSVPSEDLTIPQSKTTETTSEIVATYPCDTNLECFLAGCKSSEEPSLMECVNALEQENYFENCEGYWDVRVIQDFTRCACVQGLCKLIS